MTDYKALIQEARSGAADGDLVTASDWANIADRLTDALEASEARRVELEAVVHRVRGLLRNRTWAETLQRDVTGAMFPQTVDMDELRKIVQCAPSTVLVDHDKEVAARERRDWADWIESASGTAPPAGVTGLTIEGIVAALRAESRPFGVAATEGEHA